MALPSITRTIDDIFTTSWYEIRPEAIDNILDANVVTAALRGAGCFTPQTGGLFLTRTLMYGQKTAVNITKGSILSSGEDDIETMAHWTWRYTQSHVQRSLIDDQKNSGPSRIKSLVGVKLQAARDALDTKIEADFLVDYTAPSTTALEQAETRPQGLYAMVPRNADYADNVYGGVDRGDQTWWQRSADSSSDQWTSPQDVNMFSDMRTTYNTCGQNKSYPKLIITDQANHELFEEFADDKTQLIKDEGGRLADLGYEVLRFKGKPLVWSNLIGTTVGSDTYGKAGDMLFLNTDYIEVVYDPQMWFDMTSFKEHPTQAERLAHIFIAWNMICTQLRRQGLRYTTA